MGKVIGVAGDLVEDVIVWVSGPIAYGTDTSSQIFRVRGGSAANVAHAISSQCGDSRLLTRVGADEQGDWLISQMERSGTAVFAQRGGTSDAIVIIIDEHGERTMLPDRRNARSIEPINAAWLDGLNWLHLPMYGFETPGEAAVFTELCNQATAQHIPLSIDVSSLGLIQHLGAPRVHEILATLQPRVVFANEDEARALGLDAASPAHGTCWVLKHGADPVLIRTDSGDFAIDVEPVNNVVDTTGAGDHFAAGMLRGLVDGLELAQAAQQGIAASRKILSTPGAHSG